MSRKLYIITVLLLTGCITVPPSQPEGAQKTREPETAARPVEIVREKIVTTTTVSDTDRLLSYYGYVTSLPKDQYAKELDQARRFHESNASAFARMKYAIVRLAAPGELREQEKILELLQGQLSVKNDNSTELQALATMLKRLIVDNRSLESSLDIQREKLKEESKKSEALRQKLDALVEAERKLLERNRPK